MSYCVPGCTIIEMSTGHPPYSELEPAQAMWRIASDPSLPSFPDHLSPDAISFLKLCFVNDPTKRATARELLRHPFVTAQWEGERECVVEKEVEMEEKEDGGGKSAGEAVGKKKGKGTRKKKGVKGKKREKVRKHLNRNAGETSSGREKEKEGGEDEDEDDEDDNEKAPAELTISNQADIIAPLMSPALSLSHFPRPLLCRIFSYLPAILDLVRVGGVCMHWRVCSSSPFLWIRMWQRHATTQSKHTGHVSATRTDANVNLSPVSTYPLREESLDSNLWGRLGMRCDFFDGLVRAI